MTLQVHCLVYLDGVPQPGNVKYEDFREELFEVAETDRISVIKNRILANWPGYVSPLVFSPKKPGSGLQLSVGDAYSILSEKHISDCGESLSPLSSIPPGCLLVFLHPSRHSQEDYSSSHGDSSEVQDIVAELNRSYEKYTRSVLQAPTPSVSSNSSDYGTNQGSETALLDGCYSDGASTTAIPIELYHPAFANFMSRSQDTDADADIPEDVLRKTAKLIRALSFITTSETARDNGCRQILADILGVPIDTLTNPDKTSPDFMYVCSTPLNVSASPFIGDIKSYMGSTQSDPSVQLSFSHCKFYCQKNRQRVLKISCCPTFLLSLAGPWICIMGAVMTHRTIVQRLSPYEWFGCSRVLDNAQVLRLARILYALRLGVEELKAYYTNLREPPLINSEYIHPRFCPSITSFTDSNSQTINFSYVTPLEHNLATCVTFRAKLLDGDNPGKLVVVKFVQQYGAEAHTYMAAAGFAPQLIHYEKLDPKYNGLSLVVMDHVQGKTLHDRYADNPLPTNVCDTVQKAVNKLTQGGFIFGDLRRANIMLEDGEGPVETRLCFVDFDWACHETSGARYPFHVSSDIQKDSGAKEYGVITRKHQELLFAKLR